MGTLVVGAIVAAALAVAVHSIVKNKKSGKGCSGCSGCSSAGKSGCPSK